MVAVIAPFKLLAQPCVPRTRARGTPTGCDGLATKDGPIITVPLYGGVSEAIAACDETELGLQAGGFAHRLACALTTSQGLHFAGVTVNETPAFRVDQMSSVGIKVSGSTREVRACAVCEVAHERLVSSAARTTAMSSHHCPSSVTQTRLPCH